MGSVAPDFERQTPPRPLQMLRWKVMCATQRLVRSQLIVPVIHSPGPGDAGPWEIVPTWALPSSFQWLFLYCL